MLFRLSDALPIHGGINVPSAHDAADFLVAKLIRRGQERSDRESPGRLDL